MSDVHSYQRQGILSWAVSLVANLCKDSRPSSTARTATNAIIASHQRRDLHVGPPSQKQRYLSGEKRKMEYKAVVAQEKFARLNDKIDYLVVRNDQSGMRLMEAHKTICQLEEKNRRLEQQLGETEEERRVTYGQLRAEVDILKGWATNSERQHVEYEKHESTMKDVLEKNQTHLTETSEAVRQLEEKNSRLEHELGKAEVERRRIYGQLREEVDILKTWTNSEKQQVSDNGTTLKFHLREHDLIRAEAVEKYGKLKAEIVHLKTQNADCERCQSDMKEVLEENQTHLKETSEAVRQLEEKNRKLERLMVEDVEERRMNNGQLSIEVANLKAWTANSEKQQESDMDATKKVHLLERQLIQAEADKKCEKLEAEIFHLKRQEADERKYGICNQNFSMPDNHSDDSPSMSRRLNDTMFEEGLGVAMSDVAGLEQAKEALKEAIVYPVKYKGRLVRGLQPIKPILLYGPPGTGKTLLAKAIATEIEARFFYISVADILSKWVGDSPRLIKALFSQARASDKTSIIFIDEMDALCGSREEGASGIPKDTVTQFLEEIEGKPAEDNDMCLIGATNLPWALDDGIWRRMRKRIYIPLPGKEARIEMMHIHLGDDNTILKERDYAVLAQKLEGASGSDIAVVVKEARMGPFRRCMKATRFRKEGKHYVPCNGCRHCQIPEISIIKCIRCGAICSTMDDLFDSLPPGSMVSEPKVCMEDFNAALKVWRRTMDKDKLDRYKCWEPEAPSRASGKA